MAKMARTLNDYLSESKRSRSAVAEDARAVFEQAYRIARQVIELREKHGMTQVELAAIAGVPQAQISRIERGVVAPTTTTLAKLGTALGVELQFVERPSPVAQEKAPPPPKPSRPDPSISEKRGAREAVERT